MSAPPKISSDVNGIGCATIIFVLVIVLIIFDDVACENYSFVDGGYSNML